MKTEELEAVAKTLIELATPEMTFKRLMGAVRARHPKVMRAEVIRGALYAAMTLADTSPEKAKKLHAFALAER